MSDSGAGDQLEVERLDPDQSLVRRRRARDEEDYRAWCEYAYGMVDVGQETLHPADVLDKLVPDAARRGRADAAVQLRTDFEQTVCEQFPAPIAVPFHGFLEGPRTPLTRLLRLRDTWESVIRLLAAIALSEAAEFPTFLTPLILRNGRDQPWRECRRPDLLSESLALRIGLIEGVLHRAKESNVNLKVASLVPVEVLGEIRRLNTVRNGFSHESTKSNVQAQALIDEVYPVLREVLLDLRDMQGVQLIRVHQILAGGSAEAEQLNGHAQSRRIRELPLDERAASVALSATKVAGMARVLATVGGLMLDLSPFFYAADDNTGHRTRVLDFKSKKGSEWQLECVADSTSSVSPSAPHEAVLVRFEALLGSRGT